MKRVLSIAAAVLVSTTVSAGAAVGQDRWTAPHRLANDQARPVNVVSSGSGDIFSTYFANGVFDVSRRPSNKWIRATDPIAVREAGKGAVIDDDGNVTVAYPVDGYCPADGGDDEWGNPPEDFHIEAKFRPFREQDWRMFRLPGQWDGCTGSVPALGVDARGTVTAVWSAEGRLYAAQRRLGQRWSKPVSIARCTGTEFDVVATGGKVTAVWSSGSVRSATSRTVGRWGKVRKIADIPGEGPLNRGEHISVVGVGRGSLLAAWSDFTLRGREWYSRVRFAMADRRGRWRSPHTVERISAVPLRVQAVVTAAHEHHAVLAWHVKESDSEEGGPLRVRVLTRGSWSSPKLLDRRADDFDVNGVAATNSGAVVVWNGGETGNHFALARTRRWADGWDPVQFLSDPTEDNAARAPWVVAWKPDVVTAAFPRGRETWSSDLHLSPAG